MLISTPNVKHAACEKGIVIILHAYDCSALETSMHCIKKIRTCVKLLHSIKASIFGVCVDSFKSATIHSSLAET